MKLKNLLKDKDFEHKKALEKLLIHFLNLSKEKIYSHDNLEIPYKTYKEIKKAYKKLIKENKPLEYVLGEADFFWYKFKVDKNTLIPRPETEYMVEIISQQIFSESENTVLIDIWTGSGVIWITCTKLLNIQNTYLTDITSESLKIAKQNAEKILDKTENIFFIKSNLGNFLENEKTLTKQMQEEKTKKIITANLPYIPDKFFLEKAEKKVYRFEPQIALLWWEDWLKLYKILLEQILKQKNKYWYKNTEIFMEIMSWQWDILEKDFCKYFEFEKLWTFHFNIIILRAKI